MTSENFLVPPKGDGVLKCTDRDLIPGFWQPNARILGVEITENNW